MNQNSSHSSNTDLKFESVFLESTLLYVKVLCILYIFINMYMLYACVYVSLGQIYNTIHRLYNVSVYTSYCTSVINPRMIVSVAFNAATLGDRDRDSATLYITFCTSAIDIYTPP